MIPRSENRIYVGIPAYNVSNSIHWVLDEITKLETANLIFVVNDGSEDDTSEKVKSYCSAQLILLEHPRNLGYGGAIKTLLSNFYEHSKCPDDILVLVHGDGQTPPDEIPLLLKPFQDPNVDLVLGSRMLAGYREQVGKRPRYKIFADFLLTHVQNFLYGMCLSTYASGYRAFRRRAIERLNYSDCDNRHIFDTEILIQAKKSSLCMKEVPVRTVKTMTTSNNVPFRYIKNSLRLMLKYGFRI